MLAQVMLIQQFLLHSHSAGIQAFRVEGHTGQFFQNHGIVDSILGICTPGKGAVRTDQHSGDLIGRPMGKGFYDHIAGFFFICFDKFAILF